MSFQIHALPESLVEHLVALSDAELEQQSMRRMVADVNPGYPCRISLTDAAVGESVVLMNYEHQPHASPYRSCHAIFVREGARQARPGPGEIPASLALRLTSVRGFGRDHYLVDATVVAGRDLRQAIVDAFANTAVDYLHLHNAKPGCFAARVSRVQP